MDIEEIVDNLNAIISLQPASHIGCIAGLSKNLLKSQAETIESLKCCGNCKTGVIDCGGFQDCNHYKYCSLGYSRDNKNNHWQPIN